MATVDGATPNTNTGDTDTSVEDIRAAMDANFARTAELQQMNMDFTMSMKQLESQEAAHEAMTQTLGRFNQHLTQ